MTQARTVADFIYNYPEEKEDVDVLTFLHTNGVASTSFTFRSLKDNCLLVAKNLRLESRKQNPVLIAVEDQADFVLAFFGSILAGFIPAPMAPLRNQYEKQSFGRILKILKQGKVRSLIVSEIAAAWLKTMLLDAGLEGLNIWTIESLKKQISSEAPLPEISPEDIAYIQYTSGSTSAPKGVVVRHKNVIANISMMYRVFNRDEPARIAGWIPFYHDMGLVGHLFSVLYESGFGVFLPAQTFLSGPRLWLQTIHKYRATIAAAPAFAFEHCIRKVEPDTEWDLSCWKYIYVGSETVSLPVLEKFLDKFGSLGIQRNYFKPVYGLAEATLLVAGGSKGLQELDPYTLGKKVGAGQHRKLVAYTLEEGCEIKIRAIDSDNNLQKGLEGEICISGPGISGEYFETADQKQLNNQDGIRTGDLGIIQGKYLYITGRKKETVIIRGVNYTSEDLVFAVRSGHSLLRSHDQTACIAHFEEDMEHLWVFQEVYRHISSEDLQQLYNTIQGNLSGEFGIVADKIIFIPQGIMPRTPNYKVARLECEAQYLSGKLKVLKEFTTSGPEVKVMHEPVTRETDPVVVVGMACRFPGGADNPEKFWELLASATDAITEVQADRWDNTIFYDEKAAVPGKVNTKWAGFIDNIAHFDPALFGISAYEAPEIDPQQRLLLETSWRLIESLGWKKEKLAGTNTGVFIGVSTNDYLYMKIKLMPGMDSFNAYSGLGNANSIAANRLSYFYDLKGPSLAVDTACSSSLTAFHLGATAILNGECSQVIVGGVNAILSPGPTITLSQFGMMSPEGRCKAFDADANGYVRSEGCGLVMLKRASAARADGDRILAILNSSVLGQDGASAGMTFPNGEAQDQLIRRALEMAGLKGSAISYIEAHGTGTSAGDPIEMEEVRKNYGNTNGAPCYVGSVKANIGHLEAAAGIASVIKTVLMLQQKQIPPQIHLVNLNPRIHLENTRLTIATKLNNWETNGEKRRAAISSFGFGGSLAHIILEEPANEIESADHSLYQHAGAFHTPFVLSGHSPESLKAQVETIRDWLTGKPEISWADLCYTQAVGRSDLRYRACFLAQSQSTLLEKLNSWLRLFPYPDLYTPGAGVCFLFTGQGEHYLHMGKELYLGYPVFRNAFDRCAAAIDDPSHPFKLKDLAFSIEDTQLWTDQYMQPILFAIQYSLGILWQDCGVEPRVLLGHSLGEYAAACLAGCFEPEDGMKILYHRGILVHSLPVKGIMATLFMGHEKVLGIMDSTLVSIAAINSPQKTVVSGDPREVQRLIQYCEKEGIETYFLKSEQAFHSQLLDPILEQFHEELKAFTFHPPKRKWISSVRAMVMTEAPDAGYWTEQLRNTVQFAGAAAQLIDEGLLHFIEIGPGASTLVAVRESIGAAKSLLLRSLNIKKGDRTESYFLLDSIGKLYTSGMRINWDVILKGKLRAGQLPGQQFMHQPYWLKGMDPNDFANVVSPGKNNNKAADNTAHWHYKLEWNSIGALPEPSSGDPAGRLYNWIVVGAATPLTQALLMKLKGLNYPAFWIAATVPTDKTIKPSFQLSQQADKTECYNALAKIKGLMSRADANEWKLVFIDACPAVPASGWDTEMLENSQRRGLGLLIPLVQAMRDNALVCPVWVITEDSQAVQGKEQSPLNLGSAPTWGFCKTFFLEHPEWRGGLIDLTITDTIDEKAGNLVRKILQPQFESSVAIRAGKQYIQQLVPDPLPVAKPGEFRSDGAFIITGGLGGLGLLCARWVVSKGGRKLILISRRKFPQRSLWQDLNKAHEDYFAVQSLISLEEEGATVEIISMDVRDSSAMINLFARLDDEQVPVRGILHAAGVNWFSKIMDLDPSVFFDTLKIKVSATWNLHQLTRERDLDCFILFSSVSAVWGSVDLSHYTAANLFMDMLSQYRGLSGLKSLSINWGPWSEAGMSANPSEKALLEKLGFSLMPPNEALASMDAALSVNGSLRLIAAINWARFQPFIDFCLQPSLFANVSSQTRSIGESNQKIRDRIQNSSPEEARSLIEEIVRMELRTVTLIESTNTIDAEQRFNFMGMDSLMAISYVATLESYFQIKLQNTLTYNYPTIRALSDYLFQLMYKPEEGKTKLIDPRPAIGEKGTENGMSSEQKDLLPLQNDWFVSLKQAEGKAPVKLYCFPFAGSGISIFGHWAKYMTGEIELTGIQIPGREELAGIPAFNRMHDLVSELIKIFPQQESPYYLFGHSLGALIVYEFTIALQEAGRKLPSGIIVSGCNAPLEPGEGKIHQLDNDAFAEEVLTRYESPLKKDERRNALRQTQHLLKTDIELLETYHPEKKSVSVPLAVICGRQDPLTDPEKMRAWVQLARTDFSIFFVEGRHNLVTENGTELAQLIGNIILSSKNSTTAVS